MRAIRVFISSPADVAEERFVARGVAERLQGEFGGRLKLETFFWEHEPLLATADFQTQIESPADYDIFVSILWARLGSPLPGSFTRTDGSRFDSGTEFEYEMALKGFADTGKPEILVYRKTAIVTAALDDEEQLLERLEQKRALERFVEKWFVASDQTAKGAYHTFARPEDFEAIFEVHLRKLIEQRLGATGSGAPGTEAVWTGQSPFRGLSAFEYEHSAVFFGRTRAIAEILDALRHQSEAGSAFVLILGMSGGGKSSVARAGVVPMLTRSGVIKGVTRWSRAVFSPADSPVEPLVGLARSLLQPEALPALLERRDEAELVEQLRMDPEAVGRWLATALGDQHARLCVVVDQLEEIFTHGYITAAHRQAFVRALAALSANGRVWIIATLRSDFYPRCEELPDLMTLKEGRGQYDLATPTAGEIAQMIRFPARAAGLRFEENEETGERLDDVLRDQASSNPEVLPLLEFTLEELYQRRSGDGLLTFAAYQEIGGVEGSIARRAEHVYRALPEDVQLELNHTLDRLVTRGVSERDAATRLKARLDELPQSSKALVDAFVDARLFVTELDEEEHVVGRIAHDSLIKQWPRIQEWLADNEENLRLHTRLADAAYRWRQDPSVDLLLPQGKPLEEAHLLESRGFELSPAETVFVRQSEGRVRRNRRIRSTFMAMLAVLTVGTAVGAGVAVQQSQRASVEAETAEATTKFLVGLFQVSDPWQVSQAPGSDVSAREILDRGASRAIEELGDQPRVQASLLHAIGGVYQGLGLTQGAKPMLEQALATRRRLLGDDHPVVADTLQSLSYVAVSVGDNVETERLLREAEAIRRAEYGDDSLQVAWTLNSMSVAVANQDRLEEAIEMQMEAVRIMERDGELRGVDGVYAYNNLGYVLNAADRFYEAKNAFDSALRLAIQADAVGLRSRALSNLAASYQAIGELDKARPLHEESLALKREWFGDGHFEIGYSLNNLASLVTDQGDTDYAIALYHEAVGNFTGALGEDHPNVFVVRSNLASAYVKSGEYARAAEIYQQVLDGVEAGGGAGTSRSLSVHIGLGRSHKQLGNMELALKHYAAAVETGRNVNPEARRTGIALAGLASLGNTDLSTAEREEMFERGLEVVTRAVGEQHIDRAVVLLDFARFLDQTARSERAEALFVEALAIEDGILPDDDVRLIQHRAEYAKLFGGQ